MDGWMNVSPVRVYIVLYEMWEIMVYISIASSSNKQEMSNK